MIKWFKNKFKGQYKITSIQIPVKLRGEGEWTPVIFKPSHPIHFPFDKEFVMIDRDSYEKMVEKSGLRGIEIN